MKEEGAATAHKQLQLPQDQIKVLFMLDANVADPKDFRIHTFYFICIWIPVRVWIQIVKQVF
jgi:hypothetical protein